MVYFTNICLPKEAPLSIKSRQNGHQRKHPLFALWLLQPIHMNLSWCSAFLVSLTSKTSFTSQSRAPIHTHSLTEGAEFLSVVHYYQLTRSRPFPHHCVTAATFRSPTEHANIITPIQINQILTISKLTEGPHATLRPSGTGPRVGNQGSEWIGMIFPVTLWDPKFSFKDTPPKFPFIALLLNIFHLGSMDYMKTSFWVF